MLEYDRKQQELICRQSGLAYPIRDGVPVLIVSEARPLDSERDRSATWPVDILNPEKEQTDCQF